MSGDGREPIAIVGVGCRFPRASGPEAYWRLLAEGVDAVGEIPAERWDSALFYDPDREAPGRTNTRWAALLERVDLFDCDFFRISPREAAHMDPQQRMLLEVAWEALEDAGCPAESLAGSRTGVFVGMMFNDYGSRLMNGDPLRIDAYSGSGNVYAIAANRLSCVLDLNGPSVVVDTACSSSLVAAHLACRSLLEGECDLALAGGVNVILSPGTSIYYTRAGLMAPDGRCKTFDARANGFVRGEGAGVVVLKRLSRALADRDPIYAVIRGTAVNHDGRGNGLTAPNPRAQEAVIREAYRKAGVSPGKVAYVEAHGSGTSLGDPIELKALGAVLAEGREPGSSCAVGSVKTNIGHLEAAAGIAGLIKAALCLKKRALPPSLHFERPNSYIPFDRLPLRVVRAYEPWPEGEGPAWSGVSSFGFGGANAHAVLEEAPAEIAADRESDVPADLLLPLSARRPEALRAAAGDWLEWLRSGGGADLPLRDVAHTAAVRRSHHDHRLAVSFRTREELTAGLEGFLADRPAPGVEHGRRNPSRRRKVAFLFSGQGPQWWGMGRELLESEPVYRELVERCDRLFATLGADWSLLRELAAGEEESRLHETEIAQPAIFALQVGLAALWRSWGIEPDAVVGHSVGEVAAACVAGCLSLEDASRLVFHRGRLMQRASGLGRMASLDLSAAETEEEVARHGGRLCVAAYNGPASTVVAGEPDAVEALLAPLEARGVPGRLLRGSFAFHSPQMAPFAAELAETLAGLAPAAGRVPLLSTAPPETIVGLRLDAAYWGRQMVKPVRFAQAVESLVADRFDTFVEIGPHPVLAGPTAAILHQAGREEGAVLPSLRRHEPERRVLLGSLARLYVLGREVAWKTVAPAGRHSRLPTYPWQWERCWVDLEPPRTSGSAVRSGSAHAFHGRALELAGGGQVWEAELDLAEQPFLRDHQIQGEIVLPATAYLEMMLAAAGPEVRWLGGLSLVRPLTLADPGRVTIQVRLEPSPSGDTVGRIYSRRDDGGWTLHMKARLGAGAEEADPGSGSAEEVEAIRGRCGGQLGADEFYRLSAGRGNLWGPTFQGIETVWRGDREALGEIAAPAALGSTGGTGGFLLHPALLDAAVQVLAAALPESEGTASGAFVGAGGERIWTSGEPLPERFFSHAVVRSVPSPEDPHLVGDVRLLAPSGRLLARIWGARFRYLALAGAESAADAPEEWLYRVDWIPVRRPGSGRGAAHWLLLADSGGVAAELAARLAAAGDEVWLAGPELEPGRQSFRIRPDSAEEMRRLLDAFLEAAPLPAAQRRIVHLWSLDVPELSAASSAALADAHRRICGSAALLLRDLAGRRIPELPRISWVTRGAQAVRPGELPAASQAALWGLALASAQEQAGLWGGLVDLDPAAEASAAAGELLAELRGSGGEDQVAFRAGERRAARWVRAAAPVRPPLRWRKDAAYLVTGGLGDLGLRVARWMVEQGASRLILLGRTPLPPRAAWGTLEEGSAAARRVGAVRELERLGASIHLAAVDVGDEAALASFLEDYRREGWPPIRGVVHAAGLAELRRLEEMDGAALGNAFAAKALGAWLLDRLLAGEDLDFFVLFSSVSALHGTFGQGLSAYAAANAFLDALAHHRRARGLAAVSIGWGAWAEIGMAARHSGGADRDGLPSLPPAQAVTLLGRLLRHPGAHVAAVRIDWAAWRQAHPAAAMSPLFSSLLPPAGAAETAGPVGLSRESLLAAGPEERIALLERHLRERIAHVLRVAPDALDVREPLGERGLDSLGAVEVANWVERSLGVVLPMVHLVGGASIAELAVRILERLGEAPAAPVAVLTDAAEGAFPLSHGQRSLWYLHQLAGSNSAYNVAFSTRIRSAVDLSALRAALQALLDRHGALRARFRLEEGKPVQEIAPQAGIAFAVRDASGWGGDTLRQRVEEDYQRPFDLAGGPLLRATLFSLAADDHVLLLAAHHIAVDGWALFLLVEELGAAYPAVLAGVEPPLPSLPAGYRDFVRWQEEMLGGPEGERLWEFWRREFAVVPSSLALPTDRPRPRLQTYHGASQVFLIDRATADGLRELGRAEGATLFTTLLALFQVLLHRWSGQPEVIVGSTMAGRSRAEFEGLVGCFVNSVVLRGDLSANPSFRDFLRRMRRTVLAAFEHQDYPFPLLVERLQPVRDSGRSALFQVSFVLQNLRSLGRMPELLALDGEEPSRLDFGGLVIEPYPISQQAGQHELELEVYERPDLLVGVLQYNTDLFTAATIETLAGRLAALAAGVVAQPDVPVSALEMVSEAERQRRAVESARRHETDLRRLRVSRRRGVQLPDAVGNEAGRGK